MAIGLPIDGESSMIASLSGFYSGDARGPTSMATTVAEGGRKKTMVA